MHFSDARKSKCNDSINEARLTLPNEKRIEYDEFERYQFRAKQLRTWWQVKRPKYKIDWSFYHKKRGYWD